MLGLLIANVPHEGDAWNYTLDAVADFYERVLGIAAADQSDRHSVFTLGDLVLRIHVAVEPAPARRPLRLRARPDGRLVELT